MSERVRKTNYIRQSGIRGIAGWTVLVLFLIKMVYMAYKNGMLGMTYYAGASAVFFVIYILFGMGVVPVLKKMVSYQINRGSYRNAAKVYRVIAGTMMVLTGIIAVLLFFFSTSVSVCLFGTPLCSLLIRLMAPALMFWVASFGLRGYMEGIGNAVPGIFADVTAHVLGLCVTILFQPMFVEYGRKVGALVRQDSYAYAYAACSGGLGLLVGGVVSFLFLFLIKAMFGREMKKRIRADEMRKTDSAMDILWNFFGGYIKTVLADYVVVLLAVLLLFMYGGISGRSENGMGMLYMGIAVLILPIAFLTWQIVMPFTRQLSTIMKQADFHHAKEKTSFYLKLLSYSVFPYVVVVFALAPAVSKVFFDLQNAEFETLIRAGAGIGCLLCFGMFFRYIVSILLKPYVRNIYAVLLGISGIVFFIVLQRTGMNGEQSVAYSFMLACLFYLLLIGFVVMKKIRIYNRLLQSVVCPLVGAVFGAAVAFGIYILLTGKMPEWLLLVLCGCVIYIIHNIMVVVLQVFESHEWSAVPAGGIPVSFAKMIGKY